MGPANLGQVRRAPYGNRQNTRFDDEDLAAWELTQFREAGGKTVVDQTMPDMGRDLPGLVRIALRTGVHIVAGCGYYDVQATACNVASRTVEELAAEIVADLLRNPDEGGMPAGVIGEICVSYPISDLETKALTAAAVAHLRTGAPISIHADSPHGAAAVDVLERRGVDPRRVAIAHTDRVPDLAYQMALAERAVFVEFDYFGWERVTLGEADPKASADGQRAEAVASMLAAGFGDQLLLSQDVVTRIQLASYGGGGYAYLPHDLPPLFEAYGISRHRLHRLMTEAPARWLSWGH
jgi:phosphotriesterase-related protein